MKVRQGTLDQARSLLASFDPDGLKDAGLLPRNDLFFPSIYYPPLTQYPERDDSILDGLEWMNRDRFILYVHIPQCPSRCNYCHWVVSLQNSPAEMDAYLDRLEVEMDRWKSRLGGGRFAPRSILIGGGTPTLLPPKQMRRFLEMLTSRFELADCRQFSVEAEPATLLGADGAERLKLLSSFGVDRISMGVQSLDDGVLERMGRPHDARQALDAIEAIKTAGIGSLSIDLIYGFPGCTAETWAVALESALATGIDAYQLYRLRIVPHGDKVGPVKVQYERQPEAFPSLADVYLMKALGKVVSEARGFKENFRRIYSRGPSHISYYLRDYGCRLYDVLGIGISSWSNLGDRTVLNTGSTLKRYYSMIDDGRLPIDRGLIQTREDRQRKSAVLPIKTYGISKERYRQFCGSEFRDVYGERVRELERFGLVEESDLCVSLTERGGFFADEVAMQFYDPARLPFGKNSYADGPLNPHRAVSNRLVVG
ncbi:MAG: coproporphyrinogen III oxidase family protein [Elusimicrobia bacterium]|nr:coproporphyrinogen III oxidase family protein [Elusimicrobiota bacterium]